MSTQSLQTLDREIYYQEAEENLLKMSDAYFLKNKFRIGDGVDEAKKEFYLQNYRFLCTDNCEMIKYIEAKIAGRLEDICKKPTTYSSITQLFSLAERHIQDNGCTIDTTVTNCCSWNELEW